MLLSRGKEGITMNNLLWMLAEDAESLTGELKDAFYNDVWPYIKVILWVLVAALAVIFIVKAVTTAMAVMKAADEPQVRQEKIGAFKYLAIGLGIAILVLSLATVIVDLVLKNANAGDLEQTFLF